MFFALRGKILFTPDFDRSDAFHLNASLKYYLWQTLHRNTLPFWTQQLQGGFPLLAEGQIGALYLPNLIFYRLLSFTDAYMLSLVGSLFVFSVGFYVLLTRQRISKPVAFLLALSASFSGFISFRWVHLNLVQTVSLFPFLFLSAQQAYFSSSIRSKLIHAFLIAQLIFAGHIQIAFIGLLSLVFWYWVLQMSCGKGFKLTLREFVRNVAPVIILGLLFALPQILPTLLLMQYAGRTMLSGYVFATSYSFPIKHILSFVTPFFYGNPQTHTYPMNLKQWGVFWENTPYIGEILSGIIAVSLTIAAIKKNSVIRLTAVYFILAAVFLTLAFGSNSPFYFIFDIPPFSLFRTPAKYLIPAAFFILWASAFLIDDIVRKVKNDLYLCLVYAALVANIFFLIRTAFSYHVFVDSSKLVASSAEITPLKTRDRYVTYGSNTAWNTYFINHGWEKQADINTYERFDSALFPNSNLMYGGECFDINTGGLRLRRIDTLNLLLSDFFSASSSSQTATVSAQRLLAVAGINTFISTVPLDGLPPVFTESRDKTGLYRYHSPQTMSGYYLPHRIDEAVYLDDFNLLYGEGKISTREAMVESLASQEFTGSPRVRVLRNFETDFSAAVSGNGKSFLVIGKNWYPEWRVTIDGKPVNPVKANLIHFGVIVPAGKHIVSAVYLPYAFYAGSVIAAISLITGLALLYLKGWK